VACVCVCPLFTLRCCLVQCWCIRSPYTRPLQIWQEPGREQWPLIREEVCLSFSSKTPRVDQSDEWLIPPCCFLSLFLSASGLHECVDCHHITLTLLMPTKPPVLTLQTIPISDSLWLFFRVTVQMKVQMTLSLTGHKTFETVNPYYTVPAKASQYKKYHEFTHFFN